MRRVGLCMYQRSATSYAGMRMHILQYSVTYDSCDVGTSCVPSKETQHQARIKELSRHAATRSR